MDPGDVRGMPRRTAKDRAAVDWLLGEDQPAVRYQTLTQLLGNADDDPAVRGAREQIAVKGWAAEILERQDSRGWWVGSERLYLPKYHSTNWMLLILADLGLTKENARIRKASELWIRRFAKDDGGFGMDGSKSSHLCVAGNTARALVQFGYSDHPKVRSAFEWFVRAADKKGGWSCFGSGRNLDSWEPLSAFAVYPRAKWTEGMKRVVEQGAEFFLQRELHHQGGRYAPWYRTHYPVHYYYDLLVGLDLLTALGYTDDPRLAYAVGWLEKRRRPDGRWNLDAVHPDLEGAMLEWVRKHPKALTPFALESVGEPSKIITLRALRVLGRLDGTV